MRYYLFPFLSDRLLALVAGKENKFISFHERSPDNHMPAHTYIPYIGEFPPPGYNIT